MDLKIDGYSMSRLLDNTEFVRSFIVSLAHHIGMTIVNGPTVHSFKESSKGSESGLSAYAIIAESHIAIHTWPEIDYVRTDVSSCNEFDSQSAESFVCERLSIAEPSYIKADPDRPCPPLLDALDVIAYKDIGLK
jgi:S-adenosylmethionine/arginine decarboxylase-like enzyme